MTRDSNYLAAFFIAISILGAVADESKSPTVEHKSLPTGRFVYLEVDGPYWQIGPTVSKVQELMTRQGEKGPIQIRRTGYPFANSRSALHSRIGFMTSGDWPLETTFQEETLQAAEAASITIQGLQGTAMQRTSELETWIRQKKLEPTGTIVELISPNTNPLGSSTAEILMLYREPQPTRNPTTDRIPLESPEPPTPSAEPPGRESAAEPKAATPVPMGDLWSQKDYSSIARRLIPVAPAPVGDTQVWLGQVVFRFNAVAKGLTMTDPDHAGDFTLFADTMTARLNQIAPNALGEARKRMTAPQIDPRAETKDARRALVIRTLDTMLARISSRTLDVKGTTTEAGTLLSAIQDLIAETPP